MYVVLLLFVVGLTCFFFFFYKLSESNGMKPAAVSAMSLLQGSALSFCFVEDAILEK